MCWCKSAVVVFFRPTWHPSASPIHLQALLGGCLCAECSTPWSLGPNGVWERGLGFFSLCSAVQTRCCHTANSFYSLLYFYSRLYVCYIHTLSHDWYFHFFFVLSAVSYPFLFIIFAFLSNKSMIIKAKSTVAFLLLTFSLVFFLFIPEEQQEWIKNLLTIKLMACLICGPWPNVLQAFRLKTEPFFYWSQFLPVNIQNVMFFI